jgi:hypothetical protein
MFASYTVGYLLKKVEILNVKNLYLWKKINFESI